MWAQLRLRDPFKSLCPYPKSPQIHFYYFKCIFIDIHMFDLVLAEAPSNFIPPIQSTVEF